MDAKVLLKKIKDINWSIRQKWLAEHPGKKMMSVKSVINTLIHEFDEEAMSKHCAETAQPGTKYWGMTQQEIKDLWAANRNKGTKRGMSLDEYIGFKLKGLRVERGLFDESYYPYFDAFDKWKAKYVDNGALVYLDSEIWLNCIEGVTGRSDALFYAPDKEAIVIFDWKGDQEYDNNSYGKRLSGPLEIIPETKLNIHTLQVYLYRYMLESEGFNVKKCYIGHVTTKGVENLEPGFKYNYSIMGTVIQYAKEKCNRN